MSQQSKERTPSSVPAVSLLEAVPDALLILDASSKILWSNGAAQQLFGRAADDLKGSMFGWPAATGRDLQIEILNGDGSVSIAVMRASKVQVEGGGELTIASIRDDTVRHGADERLSLSVGRLRSAFEFSTVPSALCSDADSILLVNEQLSRLTGYSEDELIGSTFSELFEGGAVPHHGTVTLTLQTARGEQARFEVRSIAVESAAAEDLRLRELVPAQEVTPEAQSEAPPPTEELLPKTAFKHEVERRIEECRRYGNEAGLLVVGPDQLVGAPAQESLEGSVQLLDAVVAAVRTRLRKSDLLGRVTGQAVGVIIPHASAGSVGPLAAAVVECVGEITDPPGGAPITVSVGAMVLHGDRPGATVALETAIQAMLEASRAGGGRHVLAQRSG